MITNNKIMKTKKIPFTIEAWKAGGKPVTRDGSQVNHLTNLETDDGFPLIGAVNGEKFTWKLDGSFNAYPNSTNSLMLEVDCEVVYVSVLRLPNGVLISEVRNIEHCYITHPDFIKEIKVEL